MNIGDTYNISLCGYQGDLWVEARVEGDRFRCVAAVRIEEDRPLMQAMDKAIADVTAFRAKKEAEAAR